MTTTGEALPDLGETLAEAAPAIVELDEVGLGAALAAAHGLAEVGHVEDGHEVARVVEALDEALLVRLADGVGLAAGREDASQQQQQHREQLRLDHCCRRASCGPYAGSFDD